MFCGHHIFLNPDLRLQPCSVVIFWNSDLAVNEVYSTVRGTTRVLRTPDFPWHGLLSDVFPKVYAVHDTLSIVCDVVLSIFPLLYAAYSVWYSVWYIVHSIYFVAVHGILSTVFIVVYAVYGNMSNLFPSVYPVYGSLSTYTL